MTTTKLKINQNVKLDDFGTIRNYRIVKIINSEYYLQSPGVVCFTASEKWIIENEIKN